MAKKRIKVSRPMLFTWLMLAALILLFVPQSITNRFQFTFARLFHWPLRMGRNVSLAARVPEQAQDLVSRRQYEQLQNHLVNLTEELKQEREKTEKLSGLRSRRALQGAGLAQADITTASIGALHCELTINRGTQDGLNKHHYVLADNSIIGIVSEVGPRTAKVRLITDPNSAIPVRIGGLNVDMLMQGTGRHFAKIKLISTRHKVNRDDVVLAAKKPGSLDTPMIIGKVAECRASDENPLLWDITVKPACDLQRLKSVNVLIMNPKQ